jgi:hypothetical protein
MLMPDFEIVRYSPSFASEWDRMVDASKNGTFLLKRGYMDYHADRFSDHSLIILRNGLPYALLPGCACGQTYSSHAGLTYGGLILNKKATVEEVCHIFILLKDYLRRAGFNTLIYKPVPHIYHTLPAEEDLYALFRLGASVAARNVSSVIYRENPLKFRDIRKSGVRKATKRGLTVSRTTDLASFWQILSRNLQDKYGAAPVHSLDEMELLASRFPGNIALYGAFNEAEMLAGVVVYITPRVVHTQYISASPEGKDAGALDLLFDHLVHSEFNDAPCFDFGTSNENGGRFLNTSLIYQKEGFGGRAICYDTYTLNL